jgi:hypothetical protein
MSQMLFYGQLSVGLGIETHITLLPPRCLLGRYAKHTLHPLGHFQLFPRLCSGFRKHSFPIRDLMEGSLF